MIWTALRTRTRTPWTPQREVGPGGGGSRWAWQASHLMEPEEGHLSSLLCPSCHRAGFEVGARGPPGLVSPSRHHQLSGQFWVLSHLNRGDLRESGVQGCAPAPVLP